MIVKCLVEMTLSVCSVCYELMEIENSIQTDSVVQISEKGPTPLICHRVLLSSKKKTYFRQQLIYY